MDVLKKTSDDNRQLSNLTKGNSLARLGRELQAIEKKEY